MSSFIKHTAFLRLSRKCSLCALTPRKILIKRVRSSLECKSLCVANFGFLVDKNEGPTKHEPITNLFPPNMMQVQSILITPAQEVCLPKEVCQMLHRSIYLSFRTCR